MDTSALAENARVLRAITPPDAALGVLVRASAYGHALERTGETRSCRERGALTTMSA